MGLTPYLKDSDFTLYHGDVLDVLRELPAGSVHMCCTSPPFYGLRDYGTGTWEGGDEGCDHRMPPAPQLDRAGGQAVGTRGEQPSAHRGAAQFRDVCGKCGARRVDQQIGLEATPDEYVARLVEVFREVRRVLRDDGSLWVEIGDSYNADGRKGRAHMGEGKNNGYSAWVNKTAEGTKPKDLIGVPWLLAFALRADGWYLRSEIIWAKPNPMPESVTDRPTTSHSRIFLLTKSARYFYDADAIREPYQPSSLERSKYPTQDHRTSVVGEMASRQNGVKGTKGADLVRREHPAPHSAGRNRRSVWEIATQPYPEAHFATWPEKLVEPMILAGTSERGVCPECGAPWRRIIDAPKPPDLPANLREYSQGPRGGGNGEWKKWRDDHPPTTTGWRPTCYHMQPDVERPPAPVPATVLDIFGGSGTTAHVARKHGRRTILIELNEAYCKLAARRLAQLSLLAVQPDYDAINEKYAAVTEEEAAAHDAGLYERLEENRAARRNPMFPTEGTES